MIHGTGVSTVQSGLGQLEQGRQILSGSRAAIESGSAQALDDLLSVTEQTSKLIPYLETAQNAVTDINDNARAIYNTMEDMQDELDDLYSGLKSLQHSLERASDSIGAGITAAEQQAIAEEIQKKAEQLEQILAALGQLGREQAETGSLPWKTGRIWRKPFQRQIPSAMTEAPQKSLTDRSRQRKTAQKALERPRQAAQRRKRHKRKREKKSQKTAA